MRIKYIIGGSIILIFFAVLMMSLGKNKVSYSDFESAKQSKKTVQIIGKINFEKTEDYSPETNTLTFNLIDEKGAEAKVVYNGTKPQNFTTAPSLVIKGKFDNENFIATEILTKCPSKYENTDVK
jgi:cytochrome c-type biogenesis protein CcmE